MPSWLTTSKSISSVANLTSNSLQAITSPTINSKSKLNIPGTNAGSAFSNVAQIPTNTTQNVINASLNSNVASAIGSISGLLNFQTLNQSQVDKVSEGGFNYLQESGALKLDNILTELAAGSPSGNLGQIINSNLNLSALGNLTSTETDAILGSISGSIAAIKSPGDFVQGFGFDTLNNIIGGFSDISNFVRETINVIPKGFDSILGAVGGEFDVLRELVDSIEDRSGIGAGGSTNFEPNPLREYNSHNYVITFGILNTSEVNNPIILRDKGTFQKVIARTGGGMYNKRHQIPQEIELGDHAEYFIDNLISSAVISPNQKTGIALGTSLSFDVNEPYSMGNFLQSVVESAKDLGFNNYSEAVYCVKIEFIGWDENLNTNTLVAEPAYIPIKILNIDFEVSGSGSTYNLKAVPYSEVALGDEAAETKMDINVVGSTVSDLLSGVDRSVATVLNQRIDGLEDSGAIPNQSGDRYVICFPKDPSAVMKIVSGELTAPSEIQITASEQLRREKGLAELPENDPRKQASLDSVKVPATTAIFSNLENYSRDIAFMNEIGLSLMVPDDNQGGTSPAPDLSASYNEEGVADTTAGEMTVSEKAREKSFPAGSKIDEIIEKVLVDSEYAAENAAEVSTNGIRKLYRINTHVFQDDNPEAEKIKGRPPLIYVYVVVPFYTDDASFQPPSGTAANRGGIRAAAIKEYNYIYTGKNEDVLGFKINFNNSFLQEAYSNFGMNPGASASGGSDRKTYQNTGAAKGATTSNAKKKGESSSGGGTTTERSEFNITGDSRTTDIRKRIAESFHHRFLNNNVDMLSADLEIWGDPFFIPTQTGNFVADRAPGTPSKTNEGFMTYLENDVYIIVNFRTPVDYSVEGDNIVTSSLVPEFSGIYRVLTVENTFRNGKYIQNLELLRSRGQEDEGEPGAFVEVNDDVAINKGNGTEPVDGVVGGNPQGGNNDSPCDSLDILPKVGDAADRVLTNVFPELKKLANVPSISIAGISWQPPTSLFAAPPQVSKDINLPLPVDDINNAVASVSNQAQAAVNSITGISI